MSDFVRRTAALAFTAVAGTLLLVAAVGPVATSSPVAHTAPVVA